jgi:hypothetical protein
LIAAVFLSLGGCAPGDTGLSAELLGPLQSLAGPLRLTWYLSPELASESPIREIDALLASVSVAGDDVTAVVRPPLPGERKPLSLLLLPAPGGPGQNTVLWSALVLDWRENRTVIPDVLDSTWLQVDLTRALTDLASGSPLSIGTLDGSENLSGVPSSLLAGRWSVSEWEPATDPSNRFDILLIRDGPGVNSYGAALAEVMESFVRRGGGILVASSAMPGEPDSPPSPAGLWALNHTGTGENSPVLYVEDSLFLDPAAYLEGVRLFRELDAALLLAAGRGGFLKTIRPDSSSGAADTPVASVSRRTGGSRLVRKAGGFPDGGAPEASRVSEVVFRNTPQGTGAGTADSGTDFPPDPDASFSLVRGREGWELFSENWRLPARSDRIESFLSRIAEGSEEIWYPEINRQPDAAERDGGLEIALKTGSGRRFVLDPAGTRFAGGGEYIRSARGTVLWPLLSAGELDGDPRYWMDRRLFPDVQKIIRAELRTDSRLYWRIHHQGDSWIFTSNRKVAGFPNPGLMADFAGRLLQTESAVIAPATETGSGPLILIVESDTGRLYEFILSDLESGNIAATSREGVQHVLTVAQADFLLDGPVFSR